MVSFTKKKKVNSIAQNFSLDFCVSKALQQNRLGNENKPLLRDLLGEDVAKAYLDLKSANNRFINETVKFFNRSERTKIFVQGEWSITDEMACRILELIESELVKTKTENLTD